MVIGTLCNLAIVISLHDNREASGENCGRTTYELYLVAQVVCP